MHSKGAAPGLRAKQSGTVRGDVAAGSPCPQSWVPAVARSFRARTGLTHLGSGLDRDARGDLSFFAGVFVSEWALMPKVEIVDPVQRAARELARRRGIFKSQCSRLGTQNQSYRI